MLEKWNISGMTCAGCATTVEKAIGTVAGVQSVRVNVGSQTALIHISSNRTPLPQEISKAVAAVGYEAQPASPAHSADAKKINIARLMPRLRLILVFITAAPFGGHMVFGTPLNANYQLALAAFATFVLGYKFYVGAFNSLKQGNGNMDLLVTLGITSAFGYSLWSLLNGGDLYFESGVFIVTAVYLGKSLEEVARKRTNMGLATLAKSLPLNARVVKNDSEKDTSLENLTIGMIVAVNQGETIPADGIITSSDALLDESLLSGESIPVAKQNGEMAYAASINCSPKRLLIKITKVGGDTKLQQILSLADEAQFHKIPEQRFADKFSARFSFIVLMLAGLTLGYWLLENETQKGILAAVAVLVAACPCALGLATPAAILSGVNAAARSGILIRNPEALAKCKRVTIVALDKTGTLTKGEPELISIKGNKQELLTLAKALQLGSNHPLARAVLEASEKITPPAATNITNVVGKGISGNVGKAKVLLGSAQFLQEQKVEGLDEFTIPVGETAVFIAKNKRAIGALGFYDKPLNGAKHALRSFYQNDIEVVLLSGDNEGAVTKTATLLGIRNHKAGLNPEQKAREVQALKAGMAGTKNAVAAFGDGINDSAMLAAADVGIAVGKSADITAARADLVLLRQEPMLFMAALDIGRRTHRKIRQNLGWAFAYNGAILPLAAAGLMAPELAAAAMALSSISVVLSSLMLGMWRGG